MYLLNCLKQKDLKIKEIPMKKKNKFLRPDNDWQIKDLENVWEIVQEINETKYKIEHYPARFELISFEGMLSAYSTVALPGMFDHWSFGKQYVEEESKYKESHNLAFEVVINSNPSICYLMDSNTFTTQALVIAHASIGHSSFFKNNHLFKTHTKADTILPFLSRSSERIRQLEEQHGENHIEHIIDACNSLKYNSFDKEVVKSLSNRQRQEKHLEAVKSEEQRIDSILDYTLHKARKDSYFTEDYVQGTNVLRFIRDHSINAEPEVREIISIMMEINQYLYPQVHTQLMNEGWASTWHYNIMQDMYDLGYLTEGQYFEFIQLHCSVLYQRGLAEGGSSINPYKLGFDMFRDIKRICLDPTDEDKKWFPDFAGNPDWVSEVKRAAYGFKDESFISQYLSPKVIRDYRFLHVNQDFDNRVVTMSETHEDIGYNNIINTLSKQYDFFDKIPELTAYTRSGEREKLLLTIEENATKRVNIDSVSDVYEHIKFLWDGPTDIGVSEDLDL